jgi:hypothetical protein
VTRKAKKRKARESGDSDEGASSSKELKHPASLDSKELVFRRAGSTGIANRSASNDWSKYNYVEHFVQRIASSLKDTYHMLPTSDECGTGYFYSSYVVDRYGVWSYMNDSDKRLEQCIKAVGLAGLANFTESNELMQEARRNYLNAIQLVNYALGSPHEAKCDSTLLSVLVLSIYEAVSGSDKHSVTAWAHHVNGAASLIRYRGSAQFEEPRGLQFFSQVIFSLITRCLQEEVPLPPWIYQLRKEALDRLSNPEDRGWRFQETMMRFADFYGKVRRGVFTDRAKIRETALKLDAELDDAIFKDPPPSWTYKTVKDTTNPEIVFLGYYHQYENYWVAQIWNGSRAMKILLHNILYKFFESEPPSKERNTRLQYSRTAILETQANVIASIPQHLGYGPIQSPDPNDKSVGGQLPNYNPMELLKSSFYVSLSHPI